MQTDTSPSAPARTLPGLARGSPCVVGAMCIRRDDVGRAGSEKGVAEEIFRVTVDGEAVPTVLEVEPFALPAPDAPLSRGARVRNFVLTGESGSRLHGCSLTWFVRGEAPPPPTGTRGDGSAGGSGGGAASGDDSDSDSGDDNDSSMAGKENAAGSSSSSSSSSPPTPSRAVHLCVVLVSKLPAYAALAGLVRALVGQMEGAGNDPEARVSRLSSAAASLLRSVPAPLPGGAVAVHFDRVVAEERAEPAATFSLPPLHAHPVAVEEESLLLLFRLLSPAAVVTLFRVLAGEGRLVLRVPDDAVGLLAPACDALTALLYPLAWAHAYIPLLPSGFDLESMLEAPCPFIVGAPESAFAGLPASSLADLNVVDLGTGHVTVPGETSASAGGNAGSGRGGWLSPAFGGAAAAATAAAVAGDGGRGAGGSCPVPALPARVHRQLILSLQHFAKGVYGPASCRAAFGALANARPTVIADDDDDDDADDEDVEDDAAGHATARYECGTWCAASAQQGGFGRLGVQRAFLDAMLLLLGDYDDHMRATTAEEEGAAGTSSSAAAAAGRYLGLTFDRAAALSCKGEYEPFVSHLYATQAFDSFLASRLRLSAWTDPHVLYFDAVVDSVVMGKPSAFLLGPAATAAAAESEMEGEGAAAAAAAPTGSATDSAALPLLRVTCPVPLRAPAADDASGATLVPPPVSFESAYMEALQRAMAAAAEAGPLSPDGVRSPAGAATHPAGAQLSSPAALVCSPGGAAGATQLDARVNRDRLRCRRLSVLQGQQMTADAAGEGAGTAVVADATTAAASGAAPSAAPAAPGPTAQRPGFNAWISRVFAAKPAAAAATSAAAATAAEPVPPPPAPAPASSSPPRAAAKRALDVGVSEPAAGACSSPSTARASSVHVARALPASLGSPPTASKARRVPASSRALLASPLPASTITPALASPVMHAQSTRKRRRMLAVAADPSLASLASVTEGDDAAELDGDGVGSKGAAAGAAGSTAAAAASTIASPVHTVDFSAFVAAPSTTTTAATATTTSSEMSSAAAAAASAQAAAACAESAAADVRSLRVEVTRARQEAAAARVQARELAEALSHALDTIAQMERERRALVEEVQVLRRAAQGGGKGSGDEDEEVEEMEGADVDSERGGPGLVRMETFDGQEWRQLRTTGHLGDGGGGPVVAAVPAALAAPPPVPAPEAAAAAAAPSSSSSSAASPAPSRIPTLRSRGGGLSPFRLGSPRRVPVAGKGVGEVGTGEASSSAKVL